MKKTNVVAMADPLDALDMMTALVDPADDMEAFVRLTWSQKQPERQAERRLEHRREKRMKVGVDAAFVAVLCACCFIIGYCVGGMA